jgi:two-component system, NtrC family, nitrogen regulation sensor histidine kinase NtrY
MRLRTRLSLAFLAVALLPLLVVVPLALRDLRATLSRELEAQVASGTAAVEASLARSRDEVRRSIDELGQSLALEEVARELHAQGPSPRLASAGERLMRSRGLSVLSLFDAQGQTLSSGHLPARAGDPDPALFAAAQRAPALPMTVQVELRNPQGVRQVPAVVAARAMDYGALRLWVVGGTLLDEPLAAHLAALSGAQVEVTSRGAVIASSAGPPPAPLERLVDLGADTWLRLRFSRAALLEAEQGLLRAVLLLVAAGLGLALLAGLALARRITRPVEALTSAAKEVAAGDLSWEVKERASGEVAELVRTFNQMTAQLRAKTEQLVASERIAAWQEVARRLAHELKNPLTPIQMSLETLLEAKRSHSPRFEELFAEGARAVLEEVDRLRRIVDEFSRFARLPKPQLSNLALGELLGQVLSLYAAPRPGVVLSHACEPDVHVRADRDQLTQVLLNLVKNAEEAVGPGGRIEVRAFRRAAEAVIEVQDDGPGIPPEHRARLFEPYFTTKQGGTGLGLAIAARICQEHGGRLEVGGEPGRGAVFSVVLRLSQD